MQQLQIQKSIEEAKELKNVYYKTTMFEVLRKLRIANASVYCTNGTHHLTDTEFYLGRARGMVYWIEWCKRF